MAKAAAAPKTKLELVKEILNSGVRKAADIVAAAKEQGVEISLATAANYKHQLGHSKPRSKGKRAATKKVARVVRTEAGPVTSDLELENLALRLIIKAGGVEKARKLIDKVG